MPRPSRTILLLAALATASVAQLRTAEEWSNEGARLARDGHIDQAVAAYRRALKLNPRLSPVHLNLGIAYFRAGRYSEAEEPLRHFLTDQGGHAQARHLLGLCLLEQQKFAQAVEELEAVRRAAPADVSLLLPLATAYFRSGHSQQAHQIAQLMLQERGDSPEVHLLLGIGYIQGKENEKAVEELVTARRQNPNLPWVHKYLAETLVKLGREDEALPLYREELKINPRDAESAYQLGAIAERRGRDEEAAELLSSAIRFRPDYGEACYTLGKLYQRQGKPDQALPLLERAVALRPEDASSHYQLGRLYQRLGRQKEAETHLQITERLRQALREKARQAILPDQN